METRLNVYRSIIAALLFCMLYLPAVAVAADGSIPEELIRRTEQVQEADLVIAAKLLLDRTAKGERVLVIDVRGTADFEALHMAGAINVPLHFVKTKPYLKPSSVVLVDQGLAYHRLAPVCRELKNMGIDARLLDGGMNAWRRLGGPMVGDLVRQIDYGRISAADFFQEKNYAHRIVCDISATRSPESVHLMPYALHLPLPGDSANLEKIRKYKTETLLVVSEDVRGYADVGHLLAHAGFDRVFFLEGGVNAYQTYLLGLARSWQPRSQRMLRFSPCKTCGEKGTSRP